MTRADSDAEVVLRRGIALSTDERLVRRVGVAMALSLAWALGLTQSLYAQQVRGQLIDDTTGEPIAGGFVVLVQGDSLELDRTLTDRRGQFRLEAPTPGEYRLRSLIVGIRSARSEPFTLEWNQTLSYQFRIPAVLVVLPTLIIEGEKICRARPAGALPAAVLWREAQKALEAVAWTEQQQMLRHRLVRYERELDPRTLEVAGEQRSWSQSGMYRASPFASPSAERLASEGYIQDAGSGEWIYYGPDANAVLSAAFANTHCFLAGAPDPERPNLVGLEFEPASGRDVPDVKGVLWIDKETAELRVLEFRYTNPPWDLTADWVGGRIEFERLATGPWIVRRWWLRLPVIGVRAARPNQRQPLGEDLYLAALRETGGWVADIRTAEGRAVGRAGGSAIEGVVTDSSTTQPLQRAKVTLVGTIHEAVTDDSGRFRIDDLPEGTYGITFEHHELEGVGVVTPPLVITLGRDEVRSVALTVPARQLLWRTLCPNYAAEGFGILTGFVKDAQSKEPLAEAVIAIVDGDQTDGSVLARSETDWSGYYAVCGIPGDDEVTARVARRGFQAATETVRVSAGDFHHLDFELKEVETLGVPIIPPPRVGFGVGVTAGLLKPGGDGGSVLEVGPSVEGFARVITISGFQMDGGIHYSQHGIAGVPEKYTLLELFLEPRFQLRNALPGLSPFLGVRLGMAWESVMDRRADFRASGYALGGSAGLLIQLDPRVFLETGISYGALFFRDFSYAGEGWWHRCVEEQRVLEANLPRTVQACSPQQLTGPSLSPDSRIPHPNSARDDRWLGLWVGFVVPYGMQGTRKPVGPVLER